MPVLAQIQSSLEIYDLNTRGRTTLYSDTTRFEAPNWSRNGAFLIYNSQGHLFRFDLESREISSIPSGIDHLNNDHGFSPDGTQIAFSADSGDDWLTSKIYVMPVKGGTPQLITSQAPSFWHGWSPDGKHLAYVGLRNGNFDIYEIGLQGGEETRLTWSEGLDDGPDYGHEGKYIYYNSMQSGKMEIWRMNKNGNDKIQLTEDAYANWFPHPSPNGRELVYLAYMEDQGQDHPPMKDVALRLMNLKDNTIITLCEFVGGQGTINVPSWSPDGKKFAFVSYKSMP